MKKKWALLAAASMILSTLLTGCGSGEEVKLPETDGEQTTQSTENEVSTSQMGRNHTGILEHWIKVKR